MIDLELLILSIQKRNGMNILILNKTVGLVIFIVFPLQVNYVKTIDKYLIGCFLFVFATLAEYSLVLFLAARMKRYQQSDEYKKDTYKKIDLDTGSDKPVTNGNGVVNRVSMIILSCILVLHLACKSHMWKTTLTLFRPERG